MSATSELSSFDDPVFRRELLTIANFLAAEAWNADINDLGFERGRPENHDAL